MKEFPDARIIAAGNNILRNKGLLDRIKVSAYAKYLEELIDRNGLRDKITFLGRISAEEMKEQYLKCQVFVCPSVLENSPNSVAEAMLLGTPVVAARVGGIPSMITDRKEGLLYTVNDVDELADTVIELWKDEGVLPLSGRLAKAAVARARAAHDPETNFKRLIEIYKDINEKTKSR